MSGKEREDVLPKISEKLSTDKTLINLDRYWYGGTMPGSVQ
jgi:hypothetical protein